VAAIHFHSDLECESIQGAGWYTATVDTAWFGLHRIHYDEEDASDDMWVGPGVIRLRSE
jgi:hypothetical protein